jgi:hypothetical protein
MKSLLLVLLLLLPSAAALAAPTIELSAGMHRIEAEVASNNAERATGLMNRPSMPMQRGMLFVFPEAAVQCFWMKNTLIPLSIAFLDDAAASCRSPTCSRSRSTTTAPSSRCASPWR